MTDGQHRGEDAALHLAPGEPGELAELAEFGELAEFAAGTAVVLLWLAAAVLYLLAGRVAALKGRPPWPRQRTTAWLGGCGLGLLVTAGPMADAARSSFTAHMAVHLVLGMLVPLLLVLGAPVTRILRAVRPRVGRWYCQFARRRPVGVAAHPVTAFLLMTVPLILLYWQGNAVHLIHHPVLGTLLHVHFLAAGILFTYAVVGIDPNPHGTPAWLRGGAIVGAIAAHSVVAKHLYASGQVGVGSGDSGDVRQAAQLMYYGGDAVHLMLLVVFCAQVYRISGRRLRTAAPAPRPASAPGSVL